MWFWAVCSKCFLLLCTTFFLLVLLFVLYGYNELVHSIFSLSDFFLSLLNREIVIVTKHIHSLLKRSTFAKYVHRLVWFGIKKKETSAAFKWIEWVQKEPYRFLSFFRCIKCSSSLCSNRDDFSHCFSLLFFSLFNILLLKPFDAHFFRNLLVI